MAAATRHPQRAESLMKSFIRHNKGCQRRALLRRRAAARARRENPGLRKARFDTNLDCADESTDTQVSAAAHVSLPTAPSDSLRDADVPRAATVSALADDLLFEPRLPLG
ncbi:hypothetical protein B0H14DRAFT_3433287 [Mycena olivaceomarginata]|nr:hypothetical protein B0H14DRAFT_3433287 [Mycena olivaceomarginata]